MYVQNIQVPFCCGLCYVAPFIQNSEQRQMTKRLTKTVCTAFYNVEMMALVFKFIFFFFHNCNDSTMLIHKRMTSNCTHTHVHACTHIYTPSTGHQRPVMMLMVGNVKFLILKAMHMGTGTGGLSIRMAMWLRYAWN